MIAACDSGSAARKSARVWSENTTPQPKVSSGRLRSKTSMRARGKRLLQQDGEIQPRRAAARCRRCASRRDLPQPRYYKPQYFSCQVNHRPRGARISGTMPTPQREAPMAAYQREIPVRFGHCDPATFVFYPRYFEMINSFVEDWFEDGLEASFPGSAVSQGATRADRPFHDRLPAAVTFRRPPDVQARSDQDRQDVVLVARRGVVPGRGPDPCEAGARVHGTQQAHARLNPGRYRETHAPLHAGSLATGSLARFGRRCS